MQHRDRLKANCLWEEYKKERNHVTNKIKQLKRNHYIAEKVTSHLPKKIVCMKYLTNS